MFSIQNFKEFVTMPLNAYNQQLYMYDCRMIWIVKFLNKSYKTYA